MIFSFRRTLMPRLLLGLLLSWVLIPTLYAVPSLVSYQGQLNDSSGSPVTGTVDFVFSIYASEADGEALWSEPQSVQVINGVFNVALGAVTPLPPSIFLDDTVYLGVKANTDPEMLPRQLISSGAFSQTAEQLSNPIQGEAIAREAVWPEHAGRNNTIVSYYAQGTGNPPTYQIKSFQMAVDKDYIITDVSYCTNAASQTYDNSQCIISYNDGQDHTVLQYVAHGNNTESEWALSVCPPVKSFRSGVPIPAGTTLKIQVTWHNWCTVAGFEIPAQ